MKKCILIMCLLLVLPISAFSQTGSPTFTVTPLLGGYWTEGNEPIKGGMIEGLSLGYYLTPVFELNLTGQYGEFELRNINAKTRAETVHLDAVMHFGSDKAFVPYIAVGPGYVSYDHNQLDDSALINYGLGFNYFVNDNIAIRGEARHFLTFEHDYNDFNAQLGISFLFGKQPKKIAVVEQPVEQPVEKPAEPVVQPEPVKEEPAPVESLIPKEAKLNKQGYWVLEGVAFDFNKYNIKSKYFSNLNDVAKILKQYPNLKIEVQGHTDNKGSKPYNMKLSKNRANSVVTYLNKKGINKSRLVPKGYGMSKPICSNATSEGRATNRRVQFEPIKDKK